MQQTGWLNEREFLVAVAMGMISPGPVVITATFVGYLVAGFWGALVATIGIFLPSFLLVLIVAPILIRYRANPNVQGFVKGAYAAAIGTILGACVLLGRIAIGDWLTALVALGSLGRAVPLEGQQPVARGRAAAIGPDRVPAAPTRMGLRQIGGAPWRLRRTSCSSASTDRRRASSPPSTSTASPPSADSTCTRVSGRDGARPRGPAHGRPGIARRRHRRRGRRPHGADACRRRGRVAPS